MGRARPGPPPLTVGLDREILAVYTTEHTALTESSNSSKFRLLVTDAPASRRRTGVCQADG